MSIQPASVQRDQVRIRERSDNIWDWTRRRIEWVYFSWVTGMATVFAQRFGVDLVLFSLSSGCRQAVAARHGLHQPSFGTQLHGPGSATISKGPRLDFCSAWQRTFAGTDFFFVCLLFVSGGDHAVRGSDQRAVVGAALPRRAALQSGRQLLRPKEPATRARIPHPPGQRDRKGTEKTTLDPIKPS